MKPNPWFRLYTEIIDDDKLGLLAFEDRWHYIALLACKGKGILDADCDFGLTLRRVALKLGLAVRELEEVVRRLSEVGLVDRKTMQPLGWAERQFESDNSTERVRAYRERMKQARNVSETAQEAETESETEAETEKEKAAPAKPSRLKALSRPADVEEGVWADFAALRRAHKAPLTETALKAIRSEADKASYTLQQALETCCARGWRGFKAEWIARESSGVGGQALTAPRRKSDYQQRQEEMGEIIGKIDIEKTNEYWDRIRRGEFPPDVSARP